MSELWQRLGFLAFALLVYRLGTHIPIPGINPEQVAALFQQSQGTILQYFNLFSGGALERMSIFALSVVPYISSAIVMQLFSNSLPYLQELKKEGQSGRNKITQYTRYGTVVFALVQSTALTVTLQTDAACLCRRCCRGCDGGAWCPGRAKDTWQDHRGRRVRAWWPGCLQFCRSDAGDAARDQPPPAVDPGAAAADVAWRGLYRPAAEPAIDR